MLPKVPGLLKAVHTRRYSTPIANLNNSLVKLLGGGLYPQLHRAF